MATQAAPPHDQRSGGLRQRMVALVDWLGKSDLVWPIELLSAGTLLAMAALTASLLWSPDSNAEPLSPPAAAALLVGNLLPAATLMMMFGRRLAIKRATRVSIESEGSLHVRLVVLFSLLSAVPALLLAIFASILFQSGVQFWFSNSARGMLENAGALAKGYYEEKLRDVGDETVTMAGDIRYMLERTRADNPDFLNGYFDQVLRRKLSESAIVTVASDGQQRTSAVVSPEDVTRSQWIAAPEMKKLVAGENMVVSAKPDRIEAIVPLFEQPRTYLYASRAVTVPSFMLGARADAVLNNYRAMLERSRNLQMQFNALLYIISLIIMGVAVWVALLVADRLVKPVNNLVNAAQRIAEGDFSARVEEVTSRRDEIGFLSQSFNRMTERLEGQTGRLLAVNRQLDERRAFIETILESVSAAIVNIDASGAIRLANATAEKLLSSDGGTIVGHRLADLAPYLATTLAEGKSHAIVQLGDGTEPQTLAIKIAHSEGGHVVTFEDISQQLADQRRAAWSDVARRIAHEIKNPLTPIQLAAERLQRRFGNQIEDGQGIFKQLTATIVRQVGDLRNIVDEFSAFARMPKPVFRDEDLADIVGHAVFLFEVAHNEIKFECDAKDGSVHLLCDRRQIGQAVTNILKNGVESILEKSSSVDSGLVYSGRIVAKINANADYVEAQFSDNGVGLPAERDRIVEPYVTTRKSGSGLGLAIVNKIVEEHHAELSLHDNPDGGAVVRLRFRRDNAMITTISNSIDQQSALDADQ